MVGVDNSETSAYAVSYAARLARDHDGQLILCHSVNWLSTVAEAASAGIAVDTTPIINSLREEGNSLLYRAAATAKRFGVEADRRPLEGDPPTALLTLARDAGCRLIVIGTHGRRGLGRLFLGSTAEAVLRGSTIPVLTVRTETPTAREAQRCLGRILVGIDDSEPSDAARDVAINLPTEDRRELLFYSVVDVDVPIGMKYASVVEAQKYADAQAVLQRAVAAARARRIKVHEHILHGSPDDVIVSAAKEKAVDLIVLGSHGRRGLRRFFLGSVAEHVVRSATVPTLVVRTASDVPHTTTRVPEIAASHV